MGSLQESNIDDRVHIPVMLDTALAARRAHGSVFNIGLSELQAWPVRPSGEDNRGVAPGLHAEGPCETTAASRPLPEGMIGCPRRNAGFRVRRSLRPR